jgi:hypothetical protein
MFTHFAGDMCQNLVLIVKHYSKHGAWKDDLDGAFQFNGLFSAQNIEKSVNVGGNEGQFRRRSFSS